MTTSDSIETVACRTTSVVSGGNKLKAVSCSGICYNVPVMVTALPKSFNTPDEGCECAHPHSRLGMTGCHGCARSRKPS